MIRSEIIKALIPVLKDELVVCNIGLPSQELHMMDDQPTNFYMLGTMGLSSSIGLGLALAQKGKVIAIDGDGSVLTNFGTLPTIANNVADNFILLIIDNGSYGSTGDQPTYTGKKTSLKEVSIACGCENVISDLNDPNHRTQNDFRFVIVSADDLQLGEISKKCPWGLEFSIQVYVSIPNLHSRRRCRVGLLRGAARPRHAKLRRRSLLNSHDARPLRLQARF